VFRSSGIGAASSRSGSIGIRIFPDFVFVPAVVSVTASRAEGARLVVLKLRLLSTTRTILKEDIALNGELKNRLVSLLHYVPKAFLTLKTS
jgi:hypothetical protein